MKPEDINKIDTTNFLPVPRNWATSSDEALVRDNAVDGAIKVVTVINKGVALGAANQQYRNVQIKGDGFGATCTIIVDEDSQVSKVEVSNQGSGYTYGYVDALSAGLPAGTTSAVFNVIIPPQGGHGKDIYRELGAYNVLVYTRLENDTENPDFITNNDFARIGIIENPSEFGSSITLTRDKASAVGALKLVGAGYSLSLIHI